MKKLTIGEFRERLQTKARRAVENVKKTAPRAGPPTLATLPMLTAASFPTMNDRTAPKRAAEITRPMDPLLDRLLAKGFSRPDFAPKGRAINVALARTALREAQAIARDSVIAGGGMAAIGLVLGMLAEGLSATLDEVEELREELLAARKGQRTGPESP